VSALGDAMKAIKDVLLMQASIERLDGNLGRLSEDVRGLKQIAADIDKRVVRIETMIEMSGGGARQPRMEG
jgi:archaellum component FlaC